MTTLRRFAGLAFAGFAFAVSSFAGVAGAQARWTLTETLRIGGGEAGPTSFSWAKSIDADSKGRILVYEHSTQDIRMFGADGKHIRSIGRAGSGPGELRNAEGLVIARDGKIWVRDAANSRFSIFSGEGVYETSWRARFCTSQGSWAPHLDRSGRIIDEDCLIKGTSAVGYAVMAYHTDMSKVDTLAEKPECGTRDLARAGSFVTTMGRGTMYRSIPWWPGPRSTVGPDGEIWCAANSSRYELTRTAPGTAAPVQASRTAMTVPVSATERDSVIAIFEKNGPTGLDYGRIPKVKPAIDRLTVDDQGRLWVHRTNAKGRLEFDIFSSNGRIIATAELGEFRHSTYMPFVVRGDMLYAVTLDQDDLPAVVRFKIGR